MIKNMYSFERDHWQKNLTVCGVDEVGRGCMAGPVVTCAIILHENIFNPNIKDSKMLTSAKIANLHDWIIKNSVYAISIESPRMIDKHNIYQTTAIAMKKSILHLFEKRKNNLPSLILIDAMPIKLTDTPYQNIEIQSFCKGESISASIASASIVAKHTRDSIMKRMAQTFPSYDLAKHKGYGTAKHQENILANGPSILHRNSFLKNLYPPSVFAQASSECGKLSNLGTHHEKQSTIFC